MYVAEIIYRLSYCKLVIRCSPSALFAVVELPDPAICGYDRFARVRIVMLGHERNGSFARFCEVINHSLDGKPLSIRDFAFSNFTSSNMYSVS